MEADAAIEAHEVGHWGVVLDLAGAWLIDAEVGVVVDGFACCFVFNDAVEGGFMVFAFLRDGESPGAGSGCFFPAGDAGNADECAVFIKIGFLLFAVDADERRA